MTWSRLAVRLLPRPFHQFQLGVRSLATQFAMDSIPDVNIDTGKFKYILVEVKDADGKGKMIVRGYTWAGYHSDIYEAVETECGAKSVQLECLGGGRIEHTKHNKTIKVYGYSQGYGPADHSLTCDILRKHFADYDSISFSNEGY